MGADERVNAGDPFRVRADTWNNIIDSKDSYLRSRGGGVGVDGSDWSDFIPVKNESGSDIDDLTAVRITDVKIDPTDHIQSARSTPVFKGMGLSVSADYNSGTNIGIAQQSIKSGSIGMVQFSGMTLAKIHIYHEDDDLVAPKSHSGTAKMTSCSYGDTGSRIVWKESGTGDDKLAYINLGQYRSRYCTIIEGTLNSTLSSSSATGTLTNLRGLDGGLRIAETSASITVQNEFSWEGTTGGTGIAIFRIAANVEPSGDWVLTQLECGD